MEADRNKSKQAVMIILFFMAAVLLLSLIFLVILPFVSGLVKKGPEETIYNITYYPADYEHNIFEDEDYMQEERRILYTEGAESRFLTEEEYNIEGNAALTFLSGYIGALINGDGEKLRSCYSGECVKELDIPAHITMQRLYDINITYMSSVEKTGKNGMLYLEYQFKMDYKIMRNDGTFRRDIESRSSKPQYLIVAYSAEGIEITDVINTK